tara:strand:- start:4677 stop:5288 length:612 start_codon:yes stop_codon:yes gene_type:complete
VGAPLFVSFSSRTHLLGDGLLYLRKLSEALSLPDYPRTDRAPLSFWLLHRVGIGLANFGLSAEATFRTFSYASGFLYISGAVRLAAVLATRTRSRVLILFGILTTGTILLYCLLAFACLRDTTSWVPAAVVLGITIPLHLATAALVPSLLLLTSTTERNWRICVPPLVTGSIAVGILASLAFSLSTLANADSLLPILGWKTGK